jgi:hypothetical protein
LEDWLIVGDFNYIRHLENINREGDTLMICWKIINPYNLGLMEILVKGRNFTWSNMQEAPLLERLDWFFLSEPWPISYANTLSFPLSKPTCDHIPCVIRVGTIIPESNVFRFQHYCPEHNDF